ncbi:hypothetical protein HNV12_12445 [Methanococcoides sp. SA1]|nr:hypothetical protein [Methanococcoides sp. SA1]
MASENGKSLTLTLVATNGKSLELIFLKQKNGYNLLYRGTNEAPLYSSTVSYQSRSSVS